MNEVFRLVATIKTNAKTAVAEFKSAEKAGKMTGARLGTAFKKLAKIMKIVFVVGAAAATYAMGKFFTSSIKSAAEYEAGMANVQAVTGATGEEFDALGEKAKELGRVTKFTMISISEGMEALGRAGMTANEIIASMGGVASLAASQSIELGQAAEMTAGALNGFNLAADQAGRVADVYAYAASNSAIRTEDLAETLKYAMPAANALGYSLEDVAGMAMILGDNMIKGSMAGTGLSFAFSELVGMSDEFQKKLGDVGVSVDDLTGPDGKILSMAEILGVLKDKGLDAGDMFELFGKRAGKSMVILLGKGEDAIKDYTGALEECGGTAEEMAEIQLNTLSGQLEILKGSWELLKVTVGEKLIPILKDFVKGTLIPLVNKMAESAEGSDFLAKKFKALFDKIKSGIKWIVEHRRGLVTALKVITAGFAALIALKVATWIGGVVTGLTGPVGLVVALAAAGVAIGLFLKDKVPEIAEATGRVRDVVKEATGGFIDLGVAASEAYRRAAEDAAVLKDAMENLRPNMTAAFVMVGDLATETARMNEEFERSEAAKKMGGAVLQMGKDAQTAYLEMKAAIDEWRTSQKAGAEEMEETIDNMGLITGEGKTIWRSFVDTLKALTTGLREETLEEWKGIYEGIKGFLNDIFTNTCDMFKKNREARKDYEEGIAELRDKATEDEESAIEEREEKLKELEEAYRNNEISYEDFCKAKNRISKDYAEKIAEIREEEKEGLGDLSETYEEERVTIWGILKQGVHDFVRAIREKFVAIAAEQTALGIIAALTGNVAGAIAHGLAALKAGAVAVGLAVVGFQEGILAFGPTLGVIGEGPVPEAAIPLTPPILADIGKGIVSALQGVEPAYAGAGIGGQTTEVHIHMDEAAFIVREEADIEKIVHELGDEFEDRIIGVGRVKP